MLTIVIVLFIIAVALLYGAIAPSSGRVTAAGVLAVAILFTALVILAVYKWPGNPQLMP